MISAIRYEAFSPTQRGGHTEGFADYLNEDVSLWWLTSSGKTAIEERWLPQSASNRTWPGSMTGSPATVRCCRSCLCLRIVARRRAKATLFSGSKSVGSDSMFSLDCTLGHPHFVQLCRQTRIRRGWHSSTLWIGCIWSRTSFFWSGGTSDEKGCKLPGWRPHESRDVAKKL